MNTPNSPLRVLVAEDDLLARRELCALLARDPDLRVVAEAGDGAAAVEEIRRHAPDLVLLDVQMPGLDGFGVVAAIGPANMPPTIFVTAHERAAVRAFEISAVDFILKPCTEDRLEAALRKAKQHRQRHELAEMNLRLSRLLQALEKGGANAGSAGGAGARLRVKSGGEYVFLNESDIDWIEADKDYVKFHALGRSFMVHDTMAALEERLNPQRFVRIQRSAIVNVDRVMKMDPAVTGDFSVTLRDGTRLRMGRAYLEGVQKALFG